MPRCEVFPLQAGVRQLLFHRQNEAIDKIEVLLPGYAFVPPTEILGIVQPLLIVRSHVQDDGSVRDG
jgi:hypothetical protein